MALTTAEVQHVALLARIGLDDAQIAAYKGQLNTTFARIDQLEAVVLDGIEPTIHPNVRVNVMRDDLLQEPLGIEKALVNAPQREASAFLVPRIVAPGGDQDE